MRVLVCGGRKYRNSASVCAVLDKVRNALAEDAQLVIVHGACSGADTLAQRWAQSRGVAHEPHPCDWSCESGPDRNRRMLATGVDAVIAFPGGRGTAHMVGIARRAGVEVVEVRQ